MPSFGPLTWLASDPGPTRRLDGPAPGERVHRKHAKLPGALCQVRTFEGPLVTHDPQRVTCLACLKLQPEHGDVEGIANGEPVAEGTAVNLRVGEGEVVHALCPTWSRYGRGACGVRAHGRRYTKTEEPVTCRGCLRALGKLPMHAAVNVRAALKRAEQATVWAWDGLRALEEECADQMREVAVARSEAERVVELLRKRKGEVERG